MGLFGNLLGQQLFIKAGQAVKRFTSPKSEELFLPKNQSTQNQSIPSENLFAKPTPQPAPPIFNTPTPTTSGETTPVTRQAGFIDPGISGLDYLKQIPSASKEALQEIGMLPPEGDAFAGNAPVIGSNISEFATRSKVGLTLQEVIPAAVELAKAFGESAYGTLGSIGNVSDEVKLPFTERTVPTIWGKYKLAIDSGFSPLEATLLTSTQVAGDLLLFEGLLKGIKVGGQKIGQIPVERPQITTLSRKDLIEITADRPVAPDKYLAFQQLSREGISIKNLLAKGEINVKTGKAKTLAELTAEEYAKVKADQRGGINVPKDKALATQAKKFKTADEFVDSQKTYYHGTNNAQAIERGGFSISKDAQEGSSFLGDNFVEGVHLSKTKAPYKEGGQLEDVASVLEVGIRETNILKTDLKGIGNLYKKYGINEMEAGYSQKLTNALKKEGYDGISYADEVVIFNPNQIKTKSQLTDIWKQANQSPETGKTITLNLKGKAPEEFTVGGADWLAVDAQGNRTPLGLRHIEEFSSWAGRKQQARFIQKNLDKGINRILLVANQSNKGLLTNPITREFVENDIINNLGTKGQTILNKARKVFPDYANKPDSEGSLYTSKIIADARKANPKKASSKEEYLTRMSESEGLISAGQTKYIATIDKLVENNKHPAYPIEMFVKEVEEVTDPVALNQIAQESGIKAPHLRMRSNNLSLSTGQSPSLARAVESAVPVAEVPITRTVGITSASEYTPEMKALNVKAGEAMASGDVKLANKYWDQILDVGEKSLTTLFDDMPSVKIQVDRTLGDYFGEEATFQTEIQALKGDEGEINRRLAGLGKDWVQDTVHIGEVLQNPIESAIMGKPFADGFTFEPQVNISFNRAINPQEFIKINDILREYGLAGSTLQADKKGVYFYNISQGTYGKTPQQFNREIGKLIPRLDLGEIQVGNGKAVQITRTSIGQRRLLIIGNPESGAAYTYEQVGSQIQPQERAVK